MVKRLSDKVLNIRLPANEVDMLEAYCQQVSRTKTDVIRELVRSLRRKVRVPENQAMAEE
jgi:predicted DNA-binding protein